MGGSNSWRAQTNGADWMRDVEKRILHEERRPLFRSASDLLGPGLAPYAIQLTDWNAPEALFNGIFYSEPGALNSPIAGRYWIGTSYATSAHEGLQRVMEYKGATTDEPWAREPWVRKFAGDAVGNITYGPWGMEGGALPPMPAASEGYVAADQSITATSRPTETPTMVRATMTNPSASRRLLCRALLRCWMDSNGNPTAVTAFYMDPMTISGSPAAVATVAAFRIDCPVGLKTYLSAVAEMNFWVPVGGTVIIGMGASRSGTGMSPIIRYSQTAIIPQRYES